MKTIKFFRNICLLILLFSSIEGRAKTIEEFARQYGWVATRTSNDSDSNVFPYYYTFDNTAIINQALNATRIQVRARP